MNENSNGKLDAKIILQMIRKILKVRLGRDTIDFNSKEHLDWLEKNLFYIMDNDDDTKGERVYYGNNTVFYYNIILDAEIKQKRLIGIVSYSVLSFARDIPMVNYYVPTDRTFEIPINIEINTKTNSNLYTAIVAGIKEGYKTDEDEDETVEDEVIIRISKTVYGKTSKYDDDDISSKFASWSRYDQEQNVEHAMRSFLGGDTLNPDDEGDGVYAEVYINGKYYSDY